jgi:ABC-type sugar transport system permease subunit
MTEFETTEATPSEQPGDEKTSNSKSNTILIVVIVLAVLFLAGLIVAVWALLQPSAPTERIRDIFIIFMAFESLVVGVALVVLVIQIASLVNLLQNEVRPILDATNETVNTLRGTTEFLSENVVEPVIKLNGYLAGLQRVLELIGMKKR